jgi:hypothetical protein
VSDSAPADAPPAALAPAVGDDIGARIVIRRLQIISM